jgi:hypothetical protein
MKANIDEVTYETLKTNNSFGQMLDMMDYSLIFGNAVNDIVRELVQMTSLYPTIITDSELSNDKLNAVRNSDGGWTKELAILTEAVPTDSYQGGAIIDTLSQSILLGDRLPRFVWEVVSEQGLDQYIDDATFMGAYAEVNAKIEAGKATPLDVTDDYSWEQEVSTLEAFAAQLEIIQANPTANITPLITLASQSVIAGYMINNVLNSLI